MTPLLGGGVLDPQQQHGSSDKEDLPNHLINRLSLFPITSIAPLIHSFFHIHSNHSRDLPSARKYIRLKFETSTNSSSESG